MQKTLPTTKVVDRRKVVEIAITKAGGHRELEREIGVARTTWGRFLNGDTENLRRSTFERILDYVNGRRQTAGH